MPIHGVAFFCDCCGKTFAIRGVFGDELDELDEFCDKTCLP